MLEPGFSYDNIEWDTTPEKGLPDVLMLGDSITIGCFPFIRESLQGRANVFFPTKINDAGLRAPQNCRDTSFGLANIDRWIALRKWDVIHFNFGLHDFKRIDPDKGVHSDDPSLPSVNEPEVYRENMNALVRTLKGTGAALIFATTTPYPAGVVPCRLPEDCVLYNRIALEIMVREHIRVNDLNCAVKDKLLQLQRPVNVHFSPEGSRYLAGFTAAAIQDCLAKKFQ